MDRTERQKLCIKRWLEAGGSSSWLLPTGFGKTRTALTLSELLIKKNPDAKILIVVPTEIIKNQWIEGLIKHNIFNNCKVEIINTVIKKEWDCNLLILDELHVYGALSFSQVFDAVNYDMILGLTATIERLDGKEKLLLEKFLRELPTETSFLIVLVWEVVLALVLILSSLIIIHSY